MFKKNENQIDRLARTLAAALFLVAGHYWFGGLPQVLLYVLGMVSLVTAAVGFCPLYRVFGIDTSSKTINREGLTVWILAVLILLVSVAGSYASAFFTKKMFIEDFNSVNGTYKQTLYNTGQGKRTESIENYEALVSKLAWFQERYSAYKPVAIRGDKEFDSDIKKIVAAVGVADSDVRGGDLGSAHVQLEPIRSMFQAVLKRNGFSMLGMALSDFHDAMEIVVDAASKKDSGGVMMSLTEADTRLKAAEEIADTKDIRDIREKLDQLASAAREEKADVLPQYGSDLKSSFVRVYLKSE